MKGIVLDTSLWIEYLKANPKYFPVCQELLESGTVWGLELIFAELLQGAKSKRETAVILKFAAIIPVLDEPELIIGGGLLSHKNNYVNLGIGLIDSVIMYSVMRYNLKIWTLDKKIINVLDSEYVFV